MELLASESEVGLVWAAPASCNMTSLGEALVGCNQLGPATGAPYVLGSMQDPGA